MAIERKCHLPALHFFEARLHFAQRLQVLDLLRHFSLEVLLRLHRLDDGREVGGRNVGVDLMLQLIENEIRFIRNVI